MNVVCIWVNVEWRYLARFVHFRPRFAAQTLRKCVNFAVSSLAESDGREEDLGDCWKQTMTTIKPALFFGQSDFHPP